jgi:hypothetical protein
MSQTKIKGLLKALVPLIIIVTFGMLYLFSSVTPRKSQVFYGLMVLHVKYGESFTVRNSVVFTVVVKSEI